MNNRLFRTEMLLPEASHNSTQTKEFLIELIKKFANDGNIMISEQSIYDETHSIFSIGDDIIIPANFQLYVGLTDEEIYEAASGSIIGDNSLNLKEKVIEYIKELPANIKIYIDLGVDNAILYNNILHVIKNMRPSDYIYFSREYDYYSVYTTTSAQEFIVPNDMLELISIKCKSIGPFRKDTLEIGIKEIITNINTRRKEEERKKKDEI